MKKKIVLLVFIIPIHTFGQGISTTDFDNEIEKYDVSSLWVQEEDKYIPEPLGYIGDNFQRFYIHFISIIKNPNAKLEYLVYGKTKVKMNICSFQGKIIIDEAKLYDEGDAPDLKQGFITGTYEFYENPNEKGTGVLQGKFKSNFFIDKNGILKYDDLMSGANGFENNQFEGIWKSYKTKSIKVCNWGDYRIPNSGNLDFGAGEFIPDKKYENFGWINYRKTFTDEKAREKEREKWWIKD